MPKTRTMRTTDVYFSLIREFPLRRLKSKAEHDVAIDHLTRVSLKYKQTHDAAITDYIEILARLIDDYERGAGLKIDASHVTPADVIRHLIEANGMTVSQLARQTGVGQSNLAEMLSGRRDFSKTAIARICDRFRLNPALFF
jgi:antitoxin component HigA of HigAB toxin-antitoxin module